MTIFRVLISRNVPTLFPKTSPPWRKGEVHFVVQQRGNVYVFIMKKILVYAALAFAFVSVTANAAPPHQATGIKTGEITDTSAIVWTRLTRKAERNPGDGPWFEINYEGKFERVKERKHRRDPVLGVRFEAPAKGVEDIQWAVPGVKGETRVKYRPKNSKDEWKQSTWAAVEAEWDFIRQHSLTNLQPGTPYEVVVESRSSDGEAGSNVSGGFTTAPSPDKASRVEFAISTGQAFIDRNSDDGYVIYDSLLKQHPNLDFFVHTGDIVYYDRLAKTPELANYHWQRTYSLPTNVRFHNQVGSYFIKDDHDTWTNDCWPSMNAPEMGEFTFAQGIDIFVKQVPMHGHQTYRTARWGKDLQVWMVEGRDFRSPNTMEDGPEKTIWGAEQMAWFKKTFTESDAKFRILISPTPVVGPDRDKGKNDNHSNKVFAHEGNQLREFLASHKNAYVICGDRHWQYHSVHPEAGIHEFCCGPASNSHAGGWKKDDFREDYHRFLRVKGGYLSVLTDRTSDDKPVLFFRHHSETGEVVNEVQFE